MPKTIELLDLGAVLIAHDGEATMEFTNDEVIIRITNVLVRDELKND